MALNRWKSLLRPCPSASSKLGIVGLSFALMAFLAGPVRAQQIIYVDQSATGADNGTSWAEAFIHLQDALATAQMGDEVWVASGTYLPDQGANVTLGDRETSFHIPNGVAVLGGFDGSESQRDQRDWLLHETTLDGDLLGNDQRFPASGDPLRSDNSFHVVRIINAEDETRLDGFTVRGGHADEVGNSRGGAVRLGRDSFGEPSNLIHISNCYITQNYSDAGNIHISGITRTQQPILVINDTVFKHNGAGSAAGFYLSVATIVVQNATIVENLAVTSAVIRTVDADLYMEGSTVAYNVVDRFSTIEIGGEGQGTLFLWNSRITGNKVTNWGSGGISVSEANLVSINNIFSGNSTGTSGGALDLCCGRFRIVNNVFAYNSADQSGGAINSVVSNTSISNSIFWENTAPMFADLNSRSVDTVSISHSLVQEVLQPNIIDRGHLISGNPFFEDADGADNIPGTLDDNFQLTNLSTAIDAGANDSLLVDQFDIDGDGNSQERWPADFSKNVRVVDGGTGVSTVDMGVFEFGARPLGTLVLHPPESTFLPKAVLSAFPNPATTGITIVLRSQTVLNGSIRLYDVSGRYIRTIHEGALHPDAEIYVRLDAIAPGVYFIRENQTGATIPVAIVQ